MTTFDNAKNFFEACEAGKGWAGCEQYVAEDASFEAQSEPLVDVKTVQGYCDWMAGFASNIVPGSSYSLHTSSYDEESRTAIFFATFHGKHTGDGGPGLICTSGTCTPPGGGATRTPAIGMT